MRILIAEDDFTSRSILEAILRKWGHQPVSTTNGAEAWQALQTPDAPKLAILDWMMPEMNGLEVCRKVREKDASGQFYIILLTARREKGDIVRGLEAGANDYVSKPYDHEELRARVQVGHRMLKLQSQLSEAHNALSYQAVHDPLTGIPNRRAFHDRSAHEWERAVRYQRPLSCVMVDLDFFKRINDSHGHAAGDMVLTAIARLLKSQCRTSDTLCRFGGEEFCLLLPETREADAARWAERACRTIAETTVQKDDVTLRVTASFGVAERLSDCTNVEELVRLADEALAVAKQSGRNRVVQFASLREPMPDLTHASPSAGPMDNVAVRDVMSTILHCPHQQDTVRQVADFFLQLRVSSVPVVNDDGAVVGMVSETDLMTHTAFGKGWDDPIQQVMRAEVVCYDEETPVRDVYQFLSRVSLPWLVVVVGGKPTGMVSRATLLRRFRNWTATHEAAAADSGSESLKDEQQRRRRAGIIKAAKDASEWLARIPETVAAEDQDLIPLVVEEATRLQDLANDLLGHCGSSCLP